MLSFEVKNLVPDTDAVVVEVSETTTNDEIRVLILRDEHGQVFVEVRKRGELVEFANIP